MTSERIGEVERASITPADVPFDVEHATEAAPISTRTVAELEDAPPSGPALPRDLTAARSELAQGRFQAVIDRLGWARREADREVHDLLGSAYFMLARYEEARRHFKAAADRLPSDPLAQQKLTAAAANLSSGLHKPRPELGNFDAQQLLAPPLAAEPGQAPHSERPLSRLERGRAWARMTANRALGALADGGMQLWGSAGLTNAVWTNWYLKPTPWAIMQLTRMRHQLERNNLVDSYPPGETTAFVGRDLRPPNDAQRFRTADGSWNNLHNPKEGAAGVRLPRNVRRDATRPDEARLLTPNPTEVSRLLFTRDADMLEVPFLNLLAAAWIQFMLHDWVQHRTLPARGAAPAFQLPLHPDHPAHVLYRQTTMRVGASAPDPTRMPQDLGSPPAFINEVTSWWDASQIYGSDAATCRRLRSHRGGKLRLEDGRLPLDDSGLEDVGLRGNWWLGLGVLHTLFVLEHNAICDMLAGAYRSWSDEQLFNVARLINAAVLAKIHTVEWTPAILPNRALDLAVNFNWHGLFETLRYPPGERKVLRRFKVPHPVLGGIVGNPRERHGVPYGLSEEFTEVYRLHELLPDRRRRPQSARGRGSSAIRGAAGSPPVRGSPTSRRKLRATRIECELGTIEPSDPQWPMAQKIALCAATTLTSLVRHFLGVHLIAGGALAMATRNCLPASHGLLPLLWPHVHGTQRSNDLTARSQLSPSGDFTAIFSYTHTGLCALLEAMTARYDVRVLDPELDAERRGLAQAPFDLPALDNRRKLFAVMLRHAQRYLNTVYSTQAQLDADVAVQDWQRELNNLIPQGIDALRGPSLTLASLARVIACFIYLETVEHEILGSGLWNYQLWPQVQPVRVYRDQPHEPLDVYQRLITCNLTLNVRRAPLLQDLSKFTRDPAGARAFATFRAELAALQSQLREQAEHNPWMMAPAQLEANINA